MKFNKRLAALARKTKLIAMDIDGVLTGGEMIIMNSGEEVKVWNVKDRLGFHLVYRSGAGIKFAWITGRSTRQAATQAKEIGIDFLYQGCMKKKAAMEEIMSKTGIKWDEIIYIGDDLVDIPVLRMAGIGICPADAPAEVRKAADLASSLPGGKGILREAVELVLKEQGLWKKRQGTTSRDQTVKKIIRQLYYIAALIFSKFVLFLPYKAAVRFGGWLGLLAYHAISDARRITEQNLADAFPEKTAAEIKGIAKLVFVNQGKNLFELLSFPKISGEQMARIVTVDNLDALKKAFLPGKGVLIASAHSGNWELMAGAVAQTGVSLNVIVKRIYIEKLDRLLVKLRSLQGYKVFPKSEPGTARHMLRIMRNNEAMGLLIDQDTDVPGVFVDFFGRKAWTPSGLATLAAKAGSTVVLALDARMPDDTHKVLITGPFQMRKSDKPEDDLIFNTQLITSLIEDHIRKYPAQWVWMHKRWNRRPA